MPRQTSPPTRPGKSPHPSLLLGAEDDPETPDRIAKLRAGGTTESGRVIPPRPFVGLGDAAQRQVETQARAVLRQRLERIGGWNVASISWKIFTAEHVEDTETSKNLSALLCQ